MENNDSLTIKLPRELRRWLRIRAAEAEVSVSQFVRVLLETERETERRPAKRASR